MKFQVDEVVKTCLYQISIVYYINQLLLREGSF